MTEEFTTLDSGKRVEFESGFRRDVNENKPRYDLIPLLQLKRIANLFMRGAVKYGENNWKLATTDVELNRFKESGFRHFIQWMMGEVDEDHASAVVFNIWAYEQRKHELREANRNSCSQTCGKADEKVGTVKDS
jgi:hypothetical protein